MSLSAELQSFVDGPPELARAKALGYDRATGLALVQVLGDMKLRSHLEALGQTASDKEVKKAARKLAYKLKSAGVDGGVRREATVDLSVKIETERIVAVSAPGFPGRLWLVLSSLPGSGGAEIDLRDSQNERIEPIEELSIGRVRRFQAELVAEGVAQPPVLVGLDLAARVVNLAERALSADDRSTPPAFGHLTAWRDRAVALGADVERMRARGKIDPSPRPISEDALDAFAAHELLPTLSAPATAFEPIDKEFRALLHGQEEIEREAFESQAKALVEQAAVAWSKSKAQRDAAALWLEISADVLFAHGDEEMARICLALADELTEWDGSDPMSHPLVSRAFESSVDLGAAWMHREAHMRGEAHH